MSENEAVEYMENEVRCIKQASHCDRDCLKCGLVKEEQPLLESFAVAIQALTDIQAYRAIGTVEEVQDIFSLCNNLQDVVKKYSEIGTVEECRVAVERMKPKKANKVERKRDEDGFIYQIGECPCCGKLVTDDRECCDCGQKLDWSN